MTLDDFTSKTSGLYNSMIGRIGLRDDENLRWQIHPATLRSIENAIEANGITLAQATPGQPRRCLGLIVETVDTMPFDVVRLAYVKEV